MVYVASDWKRHILVVLVIENTLNVRSIMIVDNTSTYIERRLHRKRRYIQDEIERRYNKYITLFKKISIEIANEKLRVSGFRSA